MNGYFVGAAIGLVLMCTFDSWAPRPKPVNQQESYIKGYTDGYEKGRAEK